MNVGAVASPLAFVVTTQVVPEHGDANVPDAPDAGAVNVTDAFGTGLFVEAVTFATSDDPKFVLIVAPCGVPEVAVIVFPVSVAVIVQQYVVVGPTLKAASVANTAKQCEPWASPLYCAVPCAGSV